MNHFKQFCMALVLTFALAFSAFAGEMDTTVIKPSPPSQATSAGKMDTGKCGKMDTGIAFPITEIALNLLLGVLSLI